MAATSIVTISTFPTTRSKLPSLPNSSRKPFLASKSQLPTSPLTIPSLRAAVTIQTSSPTLAASASPPLQTEKPSLVACVLKRVVFSAVLWLPLNAAFFFFASGASLAATAANDSIRASGFGLKVAAALRSSGWADEAIVFTLATLPVLELRGAIPVGYWMQLDPFILTLLSVLGNMVPVPFIVVYLKRFAAFLSRESASASKFVDFLFERAKAKAGPVEEFRWLGLMLFVAVPFPGTGAWTGAIIASVLDMPFWSAVSANLVGVILAGLLVNLLVNLGLKYAVVTGVGLFFISTVMWSILRHFQKSLSSK